MPESLDSSNWDGPGGSGGQNGAGAGGQNGAGGQGGPGAPKEQSLPERMSRLEGAYQHLATKADLERGLSKLGTELRGEMHAMDTSLRKEITGVKEELTGKIGGVKDDLSEKIAAVDKRQAETNSKITMLMWGMGLVVGLLLVILRALLALQ